MVGEFQQFIYIYILINVRAASKIYTIQCMR